ncbi:MAG: hypothetical protein KC503_12085 [Myxococcales bacterium]|nr:hypothetical protein [Myxococcales bacterium]
MRRARIGSIIVLLACAACACSGADDGPDYPRDGVLRVDQLQVKGTHNSYHQRADKPLPEWDYAHAPIDEQLRDFGVRQIELDVHYAKDGTFPVFHVPGLDDRSSCATLRACLEIVRDWSRANVGHHLLFVLVEPKDDVDAVKIVGRYDALDQRILEVLSRERVLTPDDVRGSHASLRAALEADGWPTLGSTRGKVMFVMLDSGVHRDNYLAEHPTLEGRVMFARGGTSEPWASVIEIGDARGRGDEIRAAVDAGYLVRTSADSPQDSDADNRASATAAMASGAQIISSDFPARVPERDYWLELRSRCNPRTAAAPSDCSDSDVEALR